MSPKNHDITNKQIDLIRDADFFAEQNKINLNDPDFIEKYLKNMKPRLHSVLGNRTIKYGLRTERLFEATVLSLGKFVLLKTEDNGIIHAEKNCRAPDFRIVLDQGDQWLVEVKNVRRNDPFNQVMRLSSEYIKSLTNYSNIVMGELRIAIFWSLWSIWTIIDPKKFVKHNGNIRVPMMEALKENEFGRLGDVWIGTRSPLRCVLNAEKIIPQSEFSDGQAVFTIGNARMFSGEVELTNPRDRHLAEILFHFGDWSLDGPKPIIGDDGLSGAEYVSMPYEHSKYDFDGIGWASRIFARYFSIQTADGDEVVRLNGEPVPEWFAPLRGWDFENSQLPLWLFTLQPSS